MDLILLLIERGRLHGCEGEHVVICEEPRGGACGLDAGGQARNPWEEAGAQGEREAEAGDLDVNPCARVAAFTDLIVDEFGVTAHRDATAGGAEVRLCADGVLLVAEVVCQVGKHLYESNPCVGRVGLIPIGS
jgi:hypothetical protein